jgi:hypothetical protein
MSVGSPKLLKTQGCAGSGGRFWLLAPMLGRSLRWFLLGESSLGFLPGVETAAGLGRGLSFIYRLASKWELY